MLIHNTKEEILKHFTEICNEFDTFNIYLSEKFGKECYTKIEHVEFVIDNPDASGHYLTVHVYKHEITLKVNGELWNKPQRENLKTIIEFACSCNS